MAFSQYSGYIPRCQHIKTNGTQCGSPALHRKRFCYFHNRWRATSINLKRASAARSASVLELPVLEDADSIQVALMQVMRLILSRQLDHKTAGLILYGLQTASANLRHTDFEPRHKEDVIIDPRSVSETGVGDEAWSPEDFEEEDSAEEDQEADDNTVMIEAQACPEPESNEPSPATVAASNVARAPSPAKGAVLNVSRQPSPLPANRKPASEPASNSPSGSQPREAAAQRRKSAVQGASPGSEAADEKAPKGRKNGRMESANQPEEPKDLQRFQAALQGAERGNLRNLKTLFELTGIYPPRAEPSFATEFESK